jgi:hypothetical protein
VPDGFELVRRHDGLRHRFERVGERNGRPSYRRLDGVVECCWLPPNGWCTIGRDGIENGWPLEPDTAPRPGAGVWRSAKAGRSYLYDLVPDVADAAGRRRSPDPRAPGTRPPRRGGHASTPE